MFKSLTYFEDEGWCISLKDRGFSGFEMETLVAVKIEKLTFYLENLGAFRLISSLQKISFENGAYGTLISFVEGIVHEEIQHYINNGVFSFAENMDSDSGSSIINKETKIDNQTNTTDGYRSDEVEAKSANSSIDKYKLIFELKTLLMKNKIDMVLERLFDYYQSGGDTDGVNGVVQVSFRYQHYKGEKTKGVQDTTTSTTQLNQISSSILGLIDGIE